MLFLASLHFDWNPYKWLWTRWFDGILFDKIKFSCEIIFVNFFFSFNMLFQNFKFSTYSQSQNSARHCDRTLLIIIQKLNLWKFFKNMFEKTLVHSSNKFFCQIAVAWISASQMAEIHCTTARKALSSHIFCCICKQK